MNTVDIELPRIYDLLRQSRLLEAEQAAVALLRDAPQVAAVHRARAAVAQSAGRVDQAVDAMRAAVALAPGDAQLQLELGQALGAAGGIDEAIAAFRKAAATKPDLVDAWYLLGMTLYGARRDADALPALQRALALAPTHPQLIRAVAETEYALEHHAEALTLYERLAPTPEMADPALCLRLSQCRRRLGAPTEALHIVQPALLRFPDDASLWQELGWVQEDLGDAAQAQQAYARAHALRPDWGDPIGSAIALARGAAPEEMVRKAERMADAVAVPEPQRAYLHHVLGKRSDSLGEYREAARHWTEANRLRRAQDGGFERDRFAAQIDAAIATFTPALLATLHAKALPDERPLFVVGMPRSGTTLVEQILAAHPQGHGCGELTGIVAIADGIPAQTGLRWPQDAARVDAAWLRERAQAYLAIAGRGAAVDARRQVDNRLIGTRLIDKQPYNFLHIGLIAMLFAGARIVWCRRDPRDIALSIFSESFAPSATYATDLDDIAFVIAQQERLMRHWQASSPLPILEFEYERIVADTEAQIRRLVDFAGLPWDARCLDFHASGRSVQTLSRWQVRQPMHARSVGRWRNYPEWFGDI
jgi:tetratricopeptide (TPR) repeat protein